MNSDRAATQASDSSIDRLLLRIETIALHAMQTTRLTLRQALLRQPPTTPPYDFDAMRALLQGPTIRLTIYDLDATAGVWFSAVPNTPETLAALVHALSRKYPLSCQAAPNICGLLRINAPDVMAAYQTAYGASIDTVLAAKVPVDERPFWLRLSNITAPEVVKDLQAELEWIYVPSGEVLIREGERGDGMYLVVTGRMRISNFDDAGEHVVGEVGRGALVGEMAAMTPEHYRTATVYAIRDSEVIRMTWDGLQRLTQSHPQLGLGLMGEIVAKMRRTATGVRPLSQVATVAVVPSRPGLPLRRFTALLADALASLDTVYRLDSAVFDSHLGPGAAQLPEADSRNGDLVAWLNSLEFANRFVILETDVELTEWTRRCLRAADRILILVDAADTPDLGPLERQIRDAYGDQIVATEELVLLQPSHSQQPSGTHDWLANRSVNRHHHVCLNWPADIHKLARLTAGRGVGLVLGGGGARGIAHIGVLRALEEAGITLDAVGGTSFGAIIAALTAMGWGWERIQAKIREFAARTKVHFRYTLPVVSVMDGQPMNHFYETLYGSGSIEDLWVAYFCVATNLTLGRQVVLETGPVWRSVRASMSIPGIFPPVQMDGSLLVDGGVLNNLPVDVMRSRMGSGTIIASYINTEEPSPRQYSYTDSVSPWKILRSRFIPFRRAIAAPSIYDTITKTIGISSKWAIPRQKAAADLLIQHEMSDYGLFDYKAADAIMERGYQSARQAIQDWQAKIS